MRKPKYKIGDKVRVCGCLDTVIESLKYSDRYQEHFHYWFKDEKRELRYEAEYNIEIVNND